MNIKTIGMNTSLTFQWLRAAEHETTGITPNYMMLGREVTTPLDIQYCMPRSIAHIPQNSWAWILEDRMEETHKHVRENVKGAKIL